MLAEAIMSRSPETVVADHTVLHAARVMKDRNVGAVVVVDEERRPIGILTDRDLATRVVAAGSGGLPSDPGQIPVDRVMSKPVITAGRDTLIFDILRLMSSKRVRRIPIVDSKKRMLGLVSIDDAMVLLTTELANVADVLGNSSRAFQPEVAAARRATEEE